MLFHSFSFLLFFPLVTGMYFLIPKRAKQLWLLVASYYFYMSWNVQYGCLILLVTAIGYGGGLLLAQNKVRQGKRRLAVLTGSVLLCVGILFFFKYSAFAVQNINELLRAVGSVRALRVPDLILPVGISFYTFQTIGYLIDVWKGKKVSCVLRCLCHFSRSLLRGRSSGAAVCLHSCGSRQSLTMTG